MANTPSYYAILPAIVRYSEKINSRQKLLYGEITALSNKNGYCSASNKYWANLYKVSILTISRDISALEKSNFIKCVYLNDNTRHIYLLSISSTPTIDQALNTPIDQALNNNNTSNNITSTYKENRVKFTFRDAMHIYMKFFGTNLILTPNQGVHRKYINELIASDFNKNDFEDVCRHQSRKYENGDLETWIIMPNCLFKPNNFKTTLSILRNPKPQKINDKKQVINNGAKVTTDSKKWDDVKSL